MYKKANRFLNLPKYIYRKTNIFKNDRNLNDKSLLIDNNYRNYNIDCIKIFLILELALKNRFILTRERNNNMSDYLKSSHITEKEISIGGNIPAILFTPSTREGLFPTIILYHGWGSNKVSQRMRGFILSTVGYQVLIPDAIYHGKRNSIDSYNADNARKYFWKVIFNNIDESNNIIYDLILRYGADPDRIGIMGNSMGGFTAAGVFTHNPNIKSLVVFNGSCGWENSNKIFKDSFGITSSLNEKEMEETIAIKDPMNNLHRLKDRPILLLHGDADSLVSIESQRTFYNKLKLIYSQQEKIKLIEYPNLNHFVTTNMMEEAIAWFYENM